MRGFTENEKKHIPIMKIEKPLCDRDSFKCQQKDDIIVEKVKKERFVWERLKEILTK